MYYNNMQAKQPRHRLSVLSMCLVSLVSKPSSVQGFVAPGRPVSFPSISQTTAVSSASALFMIYANPGDDEALARERNDARTDVRCLLTQRAIQSFMYLCESVRDPHSAKWIEDFLGAHNQLKFHGTGAAYMETFGYTWDGPLLAMMEQEKDVVVVSAKRSGKGHKGWSKDNPYLEDRYVEFDIDIDPVSLASRILSVREQIAKEWVFDLDIIEDANQRILESYFQNMARNADGSLVAFERTVAVVLNDQTSFVNHASSPLRKGNFDLLYNLCTQASVHRLLRQLKEGGSSEVSYLWLRQFYVDRVADFFDGDQRYGRADDFLEELLRAVPTPVTEGGTTGLADPVGLAEQIIRIRSELVQEWKAIMEDVPQAHTGGVRKTLLEKQMAAWGSGTPLGGGESSSFQ